MEERQQKLEETVLESSADLAKQIEDSTVALMKRIETIEEEQLTIRHDFEKHVEYVNSVVNVFREDVAEQIREEIVEFERRKQRQNKFIIFDVDEKGDNKDVNFVEQLLNNICPGQKIKTDVTRIGKREPDLTRKQREEWQQRRSARPATNGEGIGSSETPAGRSVLAPKRKIRTNVTAIEDRATKVHKK
ncbi:unnamed protein product [Allacma fusca]|uniref:Uncharacterized protein n=1 Tax=Allacma fusca TaxID=39272 RepID=A0A8J2NU02_9HEXA|nr:unnamed protein product [Allacma fusca]